jgi:quercetin dioxygenase-like cupin family protein
MLKISKENQPKVKVFDGVVRRTLACGKDVLMAKFEYKKGSKVPPHKHSYEQVTTILAGEQKIIFSKEGKKEEIIIKNGDSYIMPANFVHEQESLTDSVTIDAWSLAP